MVELSGKDDPFQHGFPNIVFIVPTIIVIGLTGEFCIYFFRIHFKVVFIGNFLSIWVTTCFRCKCN